MVHACPSRIQAGVEAGRQAGQPNDGDDGQRHVREARQYGRHRDHRQTGKGKYKLLEQEACQPFPGTESVRGQQDDVRRKRRYVYYRDREQQLRSQQYTPAGGARDPKLAIAHQRVLVNGQGKQRGPGNGEQQANLTRKLQVARVKPGRCGLDQ